MLLNPGSPTPIFRQICEHIRRAVAAGVYRAGEPVPSLRGMAQELGVNPNTVQRAYEALEREGLLEPRKGVGMFVTPTGARSAAEVVMVTVRERFREGLRIARSADLELEEVRSAFEGAWQEFVAELAGQ